MSGTVPRPRLDPLLAPTDSRPVTLVTAAAGWGKTTAVRDWLTRVPSAAAWLTVDAADDHLAFWRHAFSAIGAVLPGAGQSGLESSPGTVGPDDVLVRAFLDAAGRPAEHPIVVIDDLHLIRDRRVHASLEQLVERAPALLKLVLVSRRSPPLPVGRWRARGVAAEVSEADLAFRPDEAAALLSTFEGLDLDADTAAWLLDRTEGWSMGLQLVARSLRESRGTPNRRESAATSTAAVAAYLMREVVERQSTDVQDFLRATCVVERFNAALCRELTSRPDAQAMLREIEDDHLFLAALDNRREWFRHCDLFRDVVITDLERRDPVGLRRLHDTAGRWFAAEGDVRLAITHTLAAGDTMQAFDLAVSSSEGASLRVDPRDWLNAIPPAFVADDPERMARFVVALALASDFEGAEAWLRRAEARLETGDLTPQRRRLAALRHEIAALRGDAEGALRNTPPLLQINADLEREDIVFERLPVNLGRSHLVLGNVEAARAMIDLLTAHHNLSEVASLVVVPALRANVEVARGRLSEARRLATGALRHGRLLAPRHFGTLDARLALAAVYVERDQLETAATELGLLHELAATLHSTLHGTFAELGRARLAWRRDDFDGAFRHLAEARRWAERSGGPALPHRVDALEAQVRLAAGDRERAAALTWLLPQTVERVLLELRLSADSDRDLAHLRLESLQLSTLRERIVRELLLARTSRTRAESDRHLRSAMELAEPEGFVLVFFEERSAMMPPAPPELEATAPLSDRQLVVLQRLAGQASNAQIAADLFISKNTLKTHMKSIYQKLGVQSRVDAVETARRLGLI